MYNNEQKLLVIIVMMSLTNVLYAQEQELQAVTKSNLVTQSAPVISANQSTQKPVSKQGFKAFIDPSTGQLTSPPNVSADSVGVNNTPNLSVQQNNALQTSHQGLYEERMPDGSYRLDLQGRFQSSIHARLDKSGKPVISHSLAKPVIIKNNSQTNEVVK